MIVRLVNNPFARGPWVLRAPTRMFDEDERGLSATRLQVAEAETARGEYVTLDELHEELLESVQRVAFEALPREVQDDIAANLVERVPALADKTSEELRDSLADSVPTTYVTLSTRKPTALRVKFSNTRSTDRVAVQKLQAKLEPGVELDPVLIADDRFIDGGHRVQAYVNAKRETIPVVDIAPLLRRDWTRWLDGEVDEGQLVETVQQVRRYLDGKHQVLDLGSVGLFSVYSVRPVSDDFALNTLQYVVPPQKGVKSGPGYSRRAEVEAWLKQIHTLAEYKRLVDADARIAPFALDSTATRYAEIRKHIQAASDAILGLGARRQRDTLILLDLSAHVNSITGKTGDVAGYAYRRSHAIEVSATAMEDSSGEEVLVHEWAHKQFFNLPQHVTAYVGEWFEANIAGDARLENLPDIDENTRKHALDKAWDGFRSAWAKWEGVAPDEYLALKARTTKTVYGDKAPLFDVFLGKQRDLVGKLHKSLTLTDAKKTGIPQQDGAKTMPKGRRVLVFSARATHPDAYIAIAMKDGGPDSAVTPLFVTAAMLRDSVEIDVKASAERNDINLDRLQYTIGQLQTPGEPDDEHIDRFFTRENFLYSTLSDSLQALQKFLAFKKLGVHTSYLFPPDNHHGFVADWIATAEREGDKFDAEATFRKLFSGYVNWEGTSRLRPTTAERLTAPEGARLRDLAAELKLTPSSYAASNVDELWAELLRYSAFHPSQVPKPLKRLLSDALEGRTPKPGQRVRVERRPIIKKSWQSEGIDEMHNHGNKRSHASRVRAYKKSGRMVAQTFATGGSLGRSNEADKYIEPYRAGSDAYDAGDPMTANPYDAGTPERGWWGRGWTKGWEVDGFPTSRDTRSTVEKRASEEKLALLKVRMAGLRAAELWKRRHSPGWVAKLGTATDLPQNPHEAGPLRDAWQAGYDEEMEESDMNTIRSMRLHERLARPKDPNQYHSQVGQCPDGYHYDNATKSCVKTADTPAHVHVHLHGVNTSKPRSEPKKAPAPEKKSGPAKPAAPVSKHPNLRKALGHAWHTVVHPFHAAWDLARKSEARKELRTKIVKAVKQEGRETKALLGTLGRALKGEKISAAERSAAIAQTADIVKTALISYAVGHIFAGGVVKALATLASPVDEIVGIAIDKPLRAVTAKVFGGAHGLLPTAFYESEQSAEAMLMKLVDAILDEMGESGIDDEEILATLSKAGMTPDAAKRMAAAAGDGADDDAGDEEKGDDEEDDDDTADEASVAPRSLGVPRNKMPQIAGENVKEFIAWLRKRQGVAVKLTRRPAAELHPTQKTLNKEKIAGFVKAGLSDELLNPIFVSRDNFILDGHHRWAAVVELDPETAMPYYRIDMNIEQLIPLAHEFDKTFTRTANESILVVLNKDPFA